MKTEPSKATASHYSLYTFTMIWLETASRQARTGKKDEARNFFRYVRNSQILEILSAYEFPALLNVDVRLMDWKIRELEKQCHPLTVSENTDLLVAINSSLQLIAGVISKLLPANGNNRSVPCSGHDQCKCRTCIEPTIVRKQNI